MVEISAFEKISLNDGSIDGFIVKMEVSNKIAERIYRKIVDLKRDSIDMDDIELSVYNMDIKMSKVSLPSYLIDRYESMYVDEIIKYMDKESFMDYFNGDFVKLKHDYQTLFRNGIYPKDIEEYYLETRLFPKEFMKSYITEFFKRHRDNKPKVSLDPDHRFKF